jgi:hypothetical protein
MVKAIKFGNKPIFSECGFLTIFYAWYIVYPVPWLFQQDKIVAWTVFYKMRRLRAQTAEPFVRKYQNTDHTRKIVSF